MRAEPYRSVAVRLRNGHLSRQLSIIGKPKDMDLSRALDIDDRAIMLPPAGLVINERRH
jgi:putative ABC transport system permease protein